MNAIDNIVEGHVLVLHDGNPECRCGGLLGGRTHADDHNPADHNFGLTNVCLYWLDQPPWSALYRIGIGYVMLPLFSRLFGKDATGWCLVLWFIGVLFALRLLPASFA